MLAIPSHEKKFMHEELFAIPDVIFTHVDMKDKSYFKYRSRNAMVIPREESLHLLVKVQLNEPTMAWVAGINIQLIAMNVDIFLALTYTDRMWWLVKSLHPLWTYSNVNDKQGFLTQFALAQWLEQDARKQTGPIKTAAAEAHRCII